MARSRSSSSKWRYVNPAYYLKRPKRLALLFIVFVGASLVVWDRQTLIQEHEVHFTIFCFMIFRYLCFEISNFMGCFDVSETI